MDQFGRSCGLAFQDDYTEHYGYEDLTRTGREDSGRVLDTSSFKDAAVSEQFVREDPAQGLQTRTYGEVDSPIRKLKEIILGLDWEITDESIARFRKTAGELQLAWQADKIVPTFLRLLKSLAQYIGVGKARAHADSINLLFSVYNALEKIVLSPGMDDASKEKLLNEELAKSQILNRILARSWVANLEQIIRKSRGEGAGVAPSAMLLPLKVLVLSLDREQSGNIIKKFRAEISFLCGKWQTDKNLLLLLTMLGAAGEYISGQGVRTASGVGRMLLATYNTLERMVLIPGLGEQKKKDITRSALRKFNQLKRSIARCAAAAPGPAALKALPQAVAASPAVPGKPPLGDAGAPRQTPEATATAQAGEPPEPEWTPQALAAHLDRLFQETDQEGLSLPFFEGRGQGRGGEVSGAQPTGSEQIGQGPSPAQPAAGFTVTAAEDSLAAATGPKELAEMVRAMHACAREVEQLRGTIGALGKKIDVLLNQQMLIRSN